MGRLVGIAGAAGRGNSLRVTLSSGDDCLLFSCSLRSGRRPGFSRLLGCHGVHKWLGEAALLAAEDVLLPPSEASITS